HLDQQGYVTKKRWRKNGSESGGKPFTRGHLYWVLSNPIYAGFITHKGRIADGQHEGIVDRETWETTQRVLAGRAPFERRLEVAEKPVRKSQGDVRQEDWRHPLGFSPGGRHSNVGWKSRKNPSGKAKGMAPVFLPDFSMTRRGTVFRQ